MMSKDALPSLDASLPRVLADLEGLGIEGLRRQWRNHLGGERSIRGIGTIETDPRLAP